MGIAATSYVFVMLPLSSSVEIAFDILKHLRWIMKEDTLFCARKMEKVLASMLISFLLL